MTTLDQLVVAAQRLTGKHASHLSDEELGVTAKGDANFARFLRQWITEYGPPYKVGRASKADSTTGDKLIMTSHADFVAAQVKADTTYRLFSDAAPQWLSEEPLLDYRKRLLAKFQQYSKLFGAAQLDSVTCPSTLGAIEDLVYADATAALHEGRTVPAGTLVAVTKNDSSGRPVTRYVGSDGSCWDQFNPPIRHVRRINVPHSYA